jgi:hypothetical protein
MLGYIFCASALSLLISHSCSALFSDTCVGPIAILCVRFCCAPFAMIGTAQQVAGLQAALNDRNETCSYNQTLDLDQILAL